MLIEPLKISNGALAAALSPEARDAAGKLPRRLKLFNWGRNDTTKGPVTLDLSISEFEAAQRKNGLERVAIDFEHNTVEGAPAYKESSLPRPVAGFGAPKLVPGDGLYLEDIVWTPMGIENALNYEDLSPAPILGKDRRLLGLHSVGLVRNGAVYGLTFFQPGSATAHNQENRHMDEDTQKAIAALTQTVETLSAEIKTLKDQMADKPDAPEGDKALDTLRGQMEALQARQLQSERNAIVDRATAEGKVIPLSADKIAEASPDFLAAMVEHLPAGQVPTSRKGGGLKDHTTEALNASLAEVARKSGYTVEQLRAGSLTPPEKKEAE